MPIPFDIDGGLLLALARGASVAALLSLFGTLVFLALVAPRAARRMPAGMAMLVDRQLGILNWASLGLAVATTVLWLVLQSADMAGSMPARRLTAVLTDVITGTAFGHVILLQLAALLATALALGRRRIRWATALAGVATALQGGHSHAASMYAGPSLLLASDVVHLWAAGAWLGGLLPLLLVVRAAPAAAGATAARWFSPLGQICLVALTVTAAFQGWVMVASIPGLVGTGYGWMALAKLALFAVLVGFAWVNRYRLAPALLHGRPAAAKRRLAGSIALQTGFGVAIVAAAAVLSLLPPSMHEQPVWPFAEMATLDTVREDPDFMREVLWAAAALAGGAALLVAAVAVRTLRPVFRGAAAMAAAVIACLAIPHLDLLFVPAYPTSFFHSPTGFAATAIVQGADLYPTHCAACHGASGHGDGPAAKGLPVPPADLTAAHLWMHSDGDLFWWLAHGIEAPEGGLAMPGFSQVLTDEDRWDLIDYIRANNAGLAFRQAGQWPQPIRAPRLQATCAGGATDLDDLRGGFVRLVIGGSHTVAGVTTIIATPDPAIRPGPGLCVASDANLARAYAIVSGMAPDRMAGAEFLIDGDGWLRAVQPQGTGPGWSDPKILASEIAGLQAHPLAGPAPMKMQM